jgi:hypothetical protein
MRRWIAIAAKLYPRRWRERYGAEFDALMEDVDADWRELANVLGGAVKMQWKNGAILVTVCGMVALGISAVMPRPYVSTAVLRATGVENLDLYHARLSPRFQSVRVRPLSGDTYEISYAHEYPAVARATTQQFVSAALRAHADTQRFRESAWRDMSWSGQPPSSDVEVISAASDPRRFGPVVRAWIVGVGLLAGLILASMFRRPKVALAAGALAFVGWIVVTAWPRHYTSTAELRFVRPLNPTVWYASTAPEPFSSRIAGIREVEVVKLAATLGDVTIDPLPPASFRISVTARDPQAAQAALRQMLFAIMKNNIMEERRYALKQGGEIRDMADHLMGEHLDVVEPAHIATP